MSKVEDGRLVRGEEVYEEKWDTSTMVWTLVYEHKHGSDVMVYATAAAAKEAVLELVRDYRAEFEVSPDITDEEALANWYELTDGTESMLIETTALRALNKKPEAGT